MKTEAKTESTVMYVLRLALTLFLIAAVVAGVLAGVNSITAPVIAKLNEEKTQQAIETVLPGGYSEMIENFDDQDGLVTKVYKGENGYAMEVRPAGFNGEIVMMVGVDFEGNVLGISLVSHTETAGLGAVAAAKTEAGNAFRSQFTGKTGEILVTKDGGNIDAITGATITSRAVCVGVSAAIACAATLG
jgi:electron transport complex protein RnfG